MKKEIDLTVEALRGFCAIIVVCHHCLYNAQVFNPNYDLRPLIGGFILPGHVMVLVFFMLSGYVIGLTYLNRENFSILTYLKKRLIRLYPIYLFATLLTLMLFNESLHAFFGTLTFTQNIASDNLTHNGPLWSLNHEVIYYLLVIPILKFKLKVKYVMVILTCLLGYSLLYKPFPLIIEGYLVGYTFWLTGFSLSSLKIKQGNYQPNRNNNLFLSLLFLLISSDIVNIFPGLLAKLNLYHSNSIYNLDFIVQFKDFSYYVYCLYAIVISASIKTKYSIFLTFFTFFCSWSQILIWLIDGTVSKNHFFYIPLFFLVVSSVLLFIKKPLLPALTYLQYLGSVSYALYVIHFPILFAIGRITFFSGSLLTFFVRVAALLIMTIAISYVLEKLIQPRISRALNKAY